MQDGSSNENLSAALSTEQPGGVHSLRLFFHGAPLHDWLTAGAMFDEDKFALIECTAKYNSILEV